MKNSEKQLVGIAILAAGIYVVISFGLPQWDAFTTNNAKAASLRDDLKSTQSQKESLNLQIALLEKNIDIPSDIQVKTFTDDTEAQATKEVLDHVVNLATDAGNKLVSLNPATVPPFLTPKPKPQNATNASGAATANGASTPATPNTPAVPTAAATTDDKTAALEQAQDSLPPLVTKGYELTVRGTYNSLQGFLRSMDKQAMVLDMMNFELENEAANSTPGAPNNAGDPSLPLRLKITLRLALQRVENIK